MSERITAMPKQEAKPTGIDSLKAKVEALGNRSGVFLQAQMRRCYAEGTFGIWQDSPVYEPKFTQDASGRSIQMICGFTNEKGTIETYNSTNTTGRYFKNKDGQVVEVLFV